MRCWSCEWMGGWTRRGGGILSGAPRSRGNEEDMGPISGVDQLLFRPGACAHGRHFTTPRQVHAATISLLYGSPSIDVRFPRAGAWLDRQAFVIGSSSSWGGHPGQSAYDGTPAYAGTPSSRKSRPKVRGSWFEFIE